MSLADVETRAPPAVARGSKERPESFGRRNAARLDALKGRDNVTNWRYLAGIWLIIAVAVAGAIYATNAILAAGLGWGWSVPILALAVVVIGASQHQLGGAIHEATHYMLFADRRLNELASDWLCAFPIYSSTYFYRLKHMAHHQFINDTERDPDFAQLEESGHWLDFPITHVEFLWAAVKQLWPPNLARYIMVQARYGAVATAASPYADPERTGSPWPIRLGLLYAGGMPLLLLPLVALGDWVLVTATLGVTSVALLVYSVAIPDSAYPRTRLEPMISHRATAVGRVVFMTVLYGVLSAVVLSGAGPAWIWFLLLWIVPLFTTFPLFMILRQWVQHGNADRGRYTNTRVFLVGPLVRYAVFPWGMDYHLPHHVFASVPHHRLKQLHEILLDDPEYREKAVVTHGYFGPDDRRTGRPTAVSVLGPAHSPRTRERIHVDNAVLDHTKITDPAALAREAALSEEAR